MIRHSLVALAAALALRVLLACTAADGAAYENGGGLWEEGGVGVGFTAYECTQAFAPLFEAPDVDAGVVPQECLDYFDRLASGPCHDAIVQVCGEEGRCEGQAACTAVRLMAEFADGELRCLAVLEDPARYPRCDADDACDALVQTVCGGAPGEYQPCVGDAPCAHALLLEADARQRLEVVEICRQALQEPSLYPRCSR